MLLNAHLLESSSKEVHYPRVFYIEPGHDVTYLQLASG